MDLLLSKIKTSYANWKIKPLKEEIYSYNTTKRILLTFDDFTDESRLKSILAILKKEKIKAIFFLIGDWASKNPVLVDTIKKAGHWVGNHTKTHTNLLQLSEKEVREEIIGGPSSTLLRPPYGKYDKKIRKIASDLGYKICYWDVDSADWQRITKDEIISNVIRNIHLSSCILLHLNGPHTIEALPYLIQEIKNRNYEFCHTGNEIAI